MNNKQFNASMKCSSRRNCNSDPTASRSLMRCLNEVQLPKELQRGDQPVGCGRVASLNEVQFPKELQRSAQYSLPPNPSEATSRALRARAWTQPHLSSAQST